MNTSQANHRLVISGRQTFAVVLTKERMVLAQYVYSAKIGLFRIVQHGHRWRSLLDAEEIDRHDSAESALHALRQQWPQARLPDRLQLWRHLPALALSHSRPADEPVIRWKLTG
ncbi:hypothetical protein [Dyella silvatica]|uniref:hypothetical protein n=1 Tax=Dyella silvatica TaxID=2992128 RepID=UPI00225BE9DD|nr:hypothetical protein [Dyella silvatica]